jgi:hypothetical protein
MEDSMCWEMDYEYFVAQQQAKEKRAEAIDKLLKDASRPAEQQIQPAKAEDAPVTEIATAK